MEEYQRQLQLYFASVEAFVVESSTLMQNGTFHGALASRILSSPVSFEQEDIDGTVSGVAGREHALFLAADISFAASSIEDQTINPNEPLEPIQNEPPAFSLESIENSLRVAAAFFEIAAATESETDQELQALKKRIIELAELFAVQLSLLSSCTERVSSFCSFGEVLIKSQETILYGIAKQGAGPLTPRLSGAGATMAGTVEILQNKLSKLRSYRFPQTGRSPSAVQTFLRGRFASVSAEIHRLSVSLQETLETAVSSQRGKHVPKQPVVGEMISSWVAKTLHASPTASGTALADVVMADDGDEADLRDKLFRLYVSEWLQRVGSAQGDVRSVEHALVHSLAMFGAVQREISATESPSRTRNCPSINKILTLLKEETLCSAVQCLLKETVSYSAAFEAQLDRGSSVLEWIRNRQSMRERFVDILCSPQRALCSVRASGEALWRPTADASWIRCFCAAIGSWVLRFATANDARCWMGLSQTGRDVVQNVSPLGVSDLSMMESNTQFTCEVLCKMSEESPWQWMGMDAVRVRRRAGCCSAGADISEGELILLENEEEGYIYGGDGHSGGAAPQRIRRGKRRQSVAFASFCGVIDDAISTAAIPGDSKPRRARTTPSGRSRPSSSPTRSTPRQQDHGAHNTRLPEKRRKGSSPGVTSFRRTRSEVLAEWCTVKINKRSAWTKLVLGWRAGLTSLFFYENTEQAEVGAAKGSSAGASLEIPLTTVLRVKADGPRLSVEHSRTGKSVDNIIVCPESVEAMDRITPIFSGIAGNCGKGKTLYESPSAAVLLSPVSAKAGAPSKAVSRPLSSRKAGSGSVVEENFENSIEAFGWLKRQNGESMKSYSSFCALWNELLLFFFQTEQQAKLQFSGQSPEDVSSSVIDLAAVTAVDPPEDCCFAVRMADASVFLTAESAETARKWCARLRSALRRVGRMSVQQRRRASFVPLAVPVPTSMYRVEAVSNRGWIWYSSGGDTSGRAVWKRRYVLLWNRVLLYLFDSSLAADSFLSSGDASTSSGVLDLEAIVGVRASAVTPSPVEPSDSSHVTALALVSAVDAAGTFKKRFVWCHERKDLQMWMEALSSIIDARNMQMALATGDEELTQSVDAVRPERLSRKSVSLIQALVSSKTIVEESRSPPRFPGRKIKLAAESVRSSLVPLDLSTSLKPATVPPSPDPVAPSPPPGRRRSPKKGRRQTMVNESSLWKQGRLGTSLLAPTRKKGIRSPLAKRRHTLSAAPRRSHEIIEAAETRQSVEVTGFSSIPSLTEKLLDVLSPPTTPSVPSHAPPGLSPAVREEDMDGSGSLKAVEEEGEEEEEGDEDIDGSGSLKAVEEEGEEEEGEEEEEEVADIDGSGSLKAVSDDDREEEEEEDMGGSGYLEAVEEEEEEEEEGEEEEEVDIDGSGSLKAVAADDDDGEEDEEEEDMDGSGYLEAVEEEEEEEEEGEEEEVDIDGSGSLKAVAADDDDDGEEDEEEEDMDGSGYLKALVPQQLPASPTLPFRPVTASLEEAMDSAASLLNTPLMTVHHTSAVRCIEPLAAGKDAFDSAGELRSNWRRRYFVLIGSMKELNGVWSFRDPQDAAVYLQQLVDWKEANMTPQAPLLGRQLLHWTETKAVEIRDDTVLLVVRRGATSRIHCYKATDMERMLTFIERCTSHLTWETDGDTIQGTGNDATAPSDAIVMCGDSQTALADLYTHWQAQCGAPDPRFVFTEPPALNSSDPVSALQFATSVVGQITAVSHQSLCTAVFIVSIRDSVFWLNAFLAQGWQFPPSSSGAICWKDGADSFKLMLVLEKPRAEPVIAVLPQFVEIPPPSAPALRCTKPGGTAIFRASQLPLELCRWVLKNCVYPDLNSPETQLSAGPLAVLDPFSGSGAVGIAALSLSMLYFGLDDDQQASKVFEEWRKGEENAI